MKPATLKKWNVEDRFAESCIPKGAYLTNYGYSLNTFGAHWERIGDALGTYWGRIGDVLGTLWGRSGDAMERI